MRRRLSLVVGVVLLSVIGAAQSEPSSTADEVIGVTKAQWAAEMRKDVTAAMKNVADEYTQFGGNYPTRLDGKALNMRISEANVGGSGSLVAAEMANEKVQVYGDVAILTYNYIAATRDEDGKVEPAYSKSTRVYVKKGGQWWLVHLHFSPAR